MAAEANAPGLAQLSLNPARQLSELTNQCKESVQQLRTSIREAKSHRAKCCEVLGAALTAILALDQAVHSPQQLNRPSHSLQKLCGEIIAAVDLAQRRVQIFSSQPRLVKYAFLPNKRVVEGKLNHVIAQLEGLTQRVWEWQAESDATVTEPTPSMAGSSKNTAMELERVYTPRSVAAIQAALSTLHDKLESGHTQANQLAVHPVIALQNKGPSSQAASETVSTQTSPKQQLAQTASFDSAQSHNKRQNFAEDFPDAVAGGSPGDNSFTKVPTLSAEQAALQLSPVVDRAPPPPSPGEEPASHLQPPTVAQHGADQGLETRNSSIKSASQYSTEDDVVPSYLAQSRTQSSRSAYSPFEAAGQGAASQHAMQQLQAAKAAEAQHSRGPSWDSRVDNTQHVSDWAMQAQLQSHMDNSMTPHTQALSCIHARSGSDTPPRIYTTSPPTGIVRAQSAMTRTPSAHHAYPVAAQGSDQRRPRASVGASPRQHRLTSQSDERRASMESYRDVYASSAISSYEVFENLGCSIIPYEELDVKRKIGDGSIGQVYLGRWQQTDVAVKVLTEMQNLASKDEVTPQDPATLQPWETEDSDESCPQQGGQKRTHAKGLIGVTTSTAGDGSPTPQANSAISTLEREVSIMASLRHPNVVMFMGLCLEPPCIVTEFCARGSLFDVLRKARSSPPFAQQLDWPKRLSMALDAAKGMLQLHSHKPPILHRDLKSPNMLVERHWRVKITDFNLSRMVHTGEQNASVTSLLANNPRWLAPEVVKEHDYSKAADVYSFGIIMWEMMTWRLPWEELNPFQIMLRLNQQDRPDVPPLDTLPGQPLPGVAAYIQLMKDCWDEDPSKRPAFDHIIISVRGLLEGAVSKVKIQKTLTEVPRLNTSCTVVPSLNKLPVVGQTPFDSKGAPPQETPTPLAPLDDKKPPMPLQVYESNRPFFGSAPVGGLELLRSANTMEKGHAHKEASQSSSLSGGPSQQEVGFKQTIQRTVERRNTWNGPSPGVADVLETAPSTFNHKQKHVAILKSK